MNCFTLDSSNFWMDNFIKHRYTCAGFLSSFQVSYSENFCVFFFKNEICNICLFIYLISSKIIIYIHARHDKYTCLLNLKQSFRHVFFIYLITLELLFKRHQFCFSLSHSFTLCIDISLVLHIYLFFFASKFLHA